MSKKAARLVLSCFSISSLLPSRVCIVTCASRPFFSLICPRRPPRLHRTAADADHKPMSGLPSHDCKPENVSQKMQAGKRSKLAGGAPGVPVRPPQTGQGETPVIPPYDSSRGRVAADLARRPLQRAPTDQVHM